MLDNICPLGLLGDGLPLQGDVRGRVVVGQHVRRIDQRRVLYANYTFWNGQYEEIYVHLRDILYCASYCSFTSTCDAFAYYDNGTCDTATGTGLIAPRMVGEKARVMVSKLTYSAAGILQYNHTFMSIPLKYISSSCI